MSVKWKGASSKLFSVEVVLGFESLLELSGKA